jgi:hypothetical protein
VDGHGHRTAMNRHPVLVPTSSGTLTGIIHEPVGEPRACLVALHGATGRAGPNRVWVRLADSLARHGILVFRLDDYDYAQPMPAKGYLATSVEAVAEGITWFRERTSGLDMLLCGRCAGAAQCLAYAALHDDAAGLALVVPVLQREPIRRKTPWYLPGLATLVKRRAHKVGRALLPSVTDRVARNVTGFDQSGLDDDVRSWVAALDPSLPIWILLGERDHQWRRLWAPESRPAGFDSAEVEVVPGVRLNSTEYLREQQIVIDRVTDWAVRCVCAPDPS